MSTLRPELNFVPMKLCKAFLWLLILKLTSCSDSKQQTHAPALPKADSVAIVHFFESLPTVENPDKEITEASEKYKSAVSRHFFNAYKFRYWIQIGRLSEVDSAVNHIFSEPGFNKNSIEAARYYNISGIIEAYKANQEESVSNFEKAVVLFDQNNDYGGAATIYLNLSNIFLSRLDYTSAYNYARKAADNYARKRDSLYLGTSLAIGAVSAINMKKKHQADSLATLAFQISQKQNNPLGKALSMYALGEIALYNGNYDKALEYFNESAVLSKKVNHSQTEIASLTSLSKVYLEKGEYKKVITLAKSVIEKAESVNNNDILYTLNRYISSAYESLGNKEEAYDYLKKSEKHFKEKAISDNSKALQELLVKYETQKKEKQIADQRLNIQQQKSNFLYAILGGALLVSVLGGIFIYHRKAQRLKLKQLQQEKENAMLNAFIQGEERERNRISYELHDGVAAMIGAAKMTLDSLPHLPEDKQKELLRKVTAILSDTHADVRHIAHNLLPVTLEQEGLIKATEQFIAEINRSNLVEISVSAHGSHTRQLPQQIQLMLFRIIQELVNNIIRHSQAQHAAIRFNQNQMDFLVEITDDGKGYQDKKKPHSQGIYSIAQRLKSIGGNFTIEKRSGHQGTQVIIDLPMP